jgi:hypothetical protein
MVTTTKCEAKQEISPLMIAIHDVCLSMSQSLEPVWVKLDGLAVRIID